MNLWEALNNLDNKNEIPYEISPGYSTEQVDAYLQQHFGADTPPQKSIYIAPNGKFIDAGDDHASLVYTLEDEKFLEKAKNYEDLVDEDDYVFVDGEVLAVLLGYVRCNNVLGELGCTYISLPDDKTITNAQARSIAKWLDECVYSNNVTSIDIGSNYATHTYWLADYTSDEIVQRIKRYYSSGRFYD
jgi:hypothetical protein